MVNVKSILQRCAYFNLQEALLLILAFTCLSVLVGCGSSTKSDPLAISFASGQLAPPPAVMANSSVQMAAMVSNDAANLGVSWMLSCGSSDATGCGVISRHTQSGVPATYTAPFNVPASGAVTITANSSSDPNQSVTAMIRITPIVYGPVSVSFSPTPPSQMVTGQTAAFTPVVTNDHLDAQGNPMGYTLTLTCGQSTGCGTLNGLSYIAPPVVPKGGAATITATSVADPTKSANAVITISVAPVSVFFSQAPSASLQAGAATIVTAKVANDFSALGVDWSVTCGNSVCGSFIPVHTKSGQVTSYTAACAVSSYTVPCPADTVTITASSTADPTKQASTTIAITPVSLRNDLLKGQYVFLMNGVDLFSSQAHAGTIVADGNGNITQSKQTLSGQSTPYMNGLLGTYFIGTDGRGIITINGLPSRPGNWLNGQEIFSVTVIDPNHALMEEFDGNGTYQNSPSGFNVVNHGRTVRGTLDLQDPSVLSSWPSGAFSFTARGSGIQVYGAYYGGVLTSDASGVISSFRMDRAYAGTSDCIGTNPAPGCLINTVNNFTKPDIFGHGTLSLGPYMFDYYIVNSGDIAFIANLGDSTGLPSGHMYAQPSAINPVTGTYVFTAAGGTPTYGGGIVSGTAPEGVGGWFACDSAGNLSGYQDANDNGAELSAGVSGTCTLDATLNGRGTIVMNGGRASKFVTYLTANHGLLMFQSDPGRAGIGTALTQSGSIDATTFQGAYSASFQMQGIIDGTRPNGSSPAGTPTAQWNDLLGQISADGISNLTGTIDLDQLNGSFLGPSGFFWTQTPDISLTGNFAGSNGRFTGQFTLVPVGTLQQFFYIVDSSTVLTLESDNNVATGILQKQTF